MEVAAHNNRLSFTELAEIVGSSAASCMRRVNKLRLDGVIVADISLVDPKALGKSLTVVVTVELDRERLDLRRCGPRHFVERVRRYRKLLGGDFRQAGFMASAGIVALQTMVDRLIEHRRAQLLAEKIRNVPGIRLEPRVIDTDMVFFRLERDGLSTLRFLAKLSERGVRIGTLCEGVVRAVVHSLVSDNDIDAAANAIRSILQAEPPRPGAIRSLVYARHCDCQSSR
ncbi:beta-eliminating lyase-related protein [Mesorhizobium sp. M1027]|uniref:beta-eliminating lyase-related protein n=1 Tax=Mesorhizobium sp. M1027 TaxID=2957050 RepID=UPI00333CB0F5